MNAKTLNKDGKRFLFSLRVGLSTVFIAIFIVIAVFVIGFSYLRFSKALFFLSNTLITSASTSINQQLQTLLAPVESASRLSAEMIADKNIDPDDVDGIMEYAKDLLRTLPQAEMAHWGDQQGNYVVSQRLNDNSILTIYFNKNTYQAKLLKVYRNKSDNIIEREEIKNTGYDPRQTAWYKVVQQAKQTEWTDVHQFYWGDEKLFGISAGTPVYQDGHLQGVFSVDVKLNSISDFLAQHKISPNGIAFIVDEEGNIKAFPTQASSNNNYANKSNLINISDLSNFSLVQAFSYFKKNKQNRFTYHYNGARYLASFIPIQNFSRYHWYIAIVVPEKDIIGKLQSYNHLGILILILLLFVALQLISFFSKCISKPVKQLAHELEEVKFFHIEAKPLLKTVIKEVFTMSSAIESMKIGLQSFRKYVPENLVRQLIYSGVAAKIGGNNREVALFFSDIINFTALAEQVGTKEIMQYMCTYLDEMTHIISENKGTVDKYMGDSIMAFWGAPLVDEQSVENACISALYCQERLKNLSETLQKSNRVIFPTRIGLHYGNAIIGNLGSSERLNYTAIGDAVNIASRLDHLNKFYGTKILVSEQVRDKVHDRFVFRILDRIVVKGRHMPFCVYELIQEKDRNVNPNLLDFCAACHRGFTAYQHQDWDKAIDYYLSALQFYPNDIACKIMIGRSHRFKGKPPPDDWNGIWIYKTK